MFKPSALAVALLLGSGSFAWAAEPAKPTKSLAETANDPATQQGSAGILRVQILLDRARFGPGEIDGQAGSNLRRALRGYQTAKGLAVNGEMDAPTWSALNADTAPALVSYTITAADVAGPYAKVPAGMEAQKELKALGYESVHEALGERFHASPALLKKLNPQAEFTKAGSLIQVPNVADLPALPKAAKVVIDKSDSTLALQDASGKVFAQYPASSGSDRDPLPIGEWKIQGVATNPTFHYNPALFWDADPSHAKATIAAGPNNPVGSAWIDLSKPHYGIHGTPTPVAIGKTQSHGCVRLSNWDVLAVVGAVGSGVPVLMQE